MSSSLPADDLNLLRGVVDFLYRTRDKASSRKTKVVLQELLDCLIEGDGPLADDGNETETETETETEEEPKEAQADDLLRNINAVVRFAGDFRHAEAEELGITRACCSTTEAQTALNAQLRLLWKAVSTAPVPEGLRWKTMEEVQAEEEEEAELNEDGIDLRDVPYADLIERLDEVVEDADASNLVFASSMESPEALQALKALADKYGLEYPQNPPSPSGR